MQMNYQPILVHWPCRTLGDHRQLCSKHLPPSVHPYKDNLKTQTHQIWRSTGHTQTDTSEHTDIISITQRKLNLLSVSPPPPPPPRRSGGRRLRQPGPVGHAVRSFSNSEITFGSQHEEINYTLNNGLNMFHLCIKC